MWKDFKEFAFKGNVLDLAIGIMIGAAFNSIVKSLVDDMIMPVIGLIFNGNDIAGLFWALDGNTYADLAAAKEAGAATLNYGAFLSAIINFLIIAFVLFLMIKGITKLMGVGKKPQQQASPEPLPKCPYCLQEIQPGATRCYHCTSELPLQF